MTILGIKIDVSVYWIEMKMEYLAVIPARSGSKGLRNKNILNLGGIPLVAWSIKQAQAIASIKHIVVSTDSEEIAKIALTYGAEVPFLRPLEISQDETSTEPVILHALDFYRDNLGFEPDGVILLQPTSPLRLAGSLREAISLFEGENADSLLSVCENHHFFWRKTDFPEAMYNFQNRPRRQDIKEVDRWYRENGSIYVTKNATFRNCQNRLGGKIAMYVMREIEGYEIDSATDFKVVSELMKGINNDY